MTKPPELCGANKRSGGTCKNVPVPGAKRCRFHGGKAPPPGPGHPAWKHGRSSQYLRALPEHMKASFLASVEDKDILSVRNEMGLFDARIVDLLDRVDAGESKAIIAQAMDLLHTIRGEAAMEGDFSRILASADEAIDLLRARADDDEAWERIQDAVEQRRKLSDTERKLLEHHQAVVDAKQLKAILTVILQSIATHVLPLQGGTTAVNSVQQDIRQLMVN